MSYRINRTDGELLVDLSDGIINNSATDLILIGRNYKGFGEWVNENFVKLLENFASTSQPANPLTGQLWYDKSEERLKIFNGIQFRSATGTIVNSSLPDNLIQGDIWIDNKNNRLYLYDGTDLTLVGPTYDAGQGKTGYESKTQTDINNVTRTIFLFYLGGVLIGVFSPENMTIPYAYSINGYEADPADSQTPKRQKLKKGFNLAQPSKETGISGFWYHGTSLNAKYLLNDQGVKKTAVNFLPTDANGETTGSIKIKNSQGLTIGKGDKPFSEFKIIGNTTYIQNLESDGDFGIRVKAGVYQNEYLDAIKIDTSLYKVDLWPGLPVDGELALKGNAEITGNLSVGGSLNVQGQLTYITSENLQIQDKTIELAVNEDSIYLDNDNLSGGGIVLKGSEGDKSILYNSAAESFVVNQNFDIGFETGALQIDGTDVLSKEVLHSTVVTSSLTSVGTLTSLQVDDININGATLSRQNGTGMTINPNGDLNVSAQNITNLKTQVWPATYQNPDMRQWAASIEYVDRAVQGKEILLSLDINGLIIDSAGQDEENTPFYEGTIENIRQVLNYMLPIEDALIGTKVKILGTRIANITATFAISISTGEDTTLQAAYVTVRKGDNSGTVEVVQSIVQNPVEGAASTIDITVERFVYKFESDGLTWVNRGVNRITV